MCALTSVINYGLSVFCRLVNDVLVLNGDMDVYNMYMGVIIFCKMVGVAAFIVMVDFVGRRLLLLFGLVVFGFGLCVVCFGYVVKSVGWIFFGFCVFILVFFLLFASVFWVFVFELFFMRAKSLVIVFVMVMFFVLGVFFDLIFLLMIFIIGVGMFVVYVIVCFASTIFVYFYIFETARKSLKEI